MNSGPTSVPRALAGTESCIRFLHGDPRLKKGSRRMHGPRRTVRKGVPRKSSEFHSQNPPSRGTRHEGRVSARAARAGRSLRDVPGGDGLIAQSPAWCQRPSTRRTARARPPRLRPARPTSVPPSWLARRPRCHGGLRPCTHLTESLLLLPAHL